ncbi:MAG: S41 family peptidase [Gemmatimonadaceae bacterium]
MIRRLLMLLFVCGTAAASQARAQTDDASLTPQQRRAVIDSIARALNDGYVFPDVATMVNKELRSRAEKGEFDAANDPSSFARLLTRDLQELGHDKHLRVGVGAAPPAGSMRLFDAPTGTFGRTRRLPGDIAYIEILSFGRPPEVVADETSRVMSAAADAKGVILDLRANGGGSPRTVALIASYMFGAKPVLLNSLYFRPVNRTDDFYTQPGVSGTKLGPDKPVFILTSSRTFSGAEEFAYDLQTLKRAKIVGETTGGGANPGGPVPLPYGMTLFVPTGRAINPITKTNWEGVGVKPDVAVEADSALDVAYRLAQKAVAGIER